MGCSKPTGSLLGPGETNAGADEPPTVGTAAADGTFGLDLIAETLRDSIRNPSIRKTAPGRGDSQAHRKVRAGEGREARH